MVPDPGVNFIQKLKFETKIQKKFQKYKFEVKIKKFLENQIFLEKSKFS